MRITGGRLRGRRLKAPAGSVTRPTSDRVREAVFSILGPPPDDAVVLDAFAGSGALGLEALSRGAGRCWFIDSARSAVRCVRGNIAALAVADACAVMCSDTLAALRRWRSRSAPFDWVFIDPPYRTALAQQLLVLLGDGQLLARAAVIVVEHDRHNRPQDRYGDLIRTGLRRYGDTEISLYAIVSSIGNVHDE
ncbi:MAG: 16S rRNA (guanine(966)-N(2))-methyltransferase RsmD [Myxococcota bacterium]